MLRNTTDYNPITGIVNPVSGVKITFCNNGSVPYPQEEELIEDFNTVDATAEVLKTNRKTVYEAIARKEIPAVRIGRLLRVPGAWLRRMAAMTDAA